MKKKKSREMTVDSYLSNSSRPLLLWLIPAQQAIYEQFARMEKSGSKASQTRRSPSNPRRD